ncbi:CRISPR-associated helicase Cas3' [Nitrosospira sp. Nsp14]|uniref:CRISPR-associated helicase Cas3' n=1 Tax=Nitrosospira sp. Nsp14 TaxID=1855333 RepID=UPI001C4339CD|nr:CRISPR-associated helicase Cas3' [Nitrosospira sp. Nsp14]
MNQCLAKSRRTGEGAVLPGQSVLSHCHIVGEVARAIMARMPDWLRLELFPAGAELIAAAHDIGKVSPTFQKKIYSALSQENEAVLSSLRGFNSDAEKLWGGHGGVSQATAEEQKTGKYIPEILGQHHGFSPNLALYQATSEVFGGQPWQTQRIELLSQLRQALAADFPVVIDGLQARVLAGLTTVSDWIGSGSLFEDPGIDWRPRIEQALDSAGFIQPRLKPGLSFVEVFGFPPKPAQTRLIEAANQPGVYVLEAPMGLGKTEAALYAAYQLLQKNLATGIYFALPTQLTSDKIHERANAFLERVLEDGSPHKQALLVHGNAWLKQFEMGEEGDPGGAWFAQGKRGILAPLAVGTVDQALMAVMNVKHGFVRSFGLAGKVVILDEVHSYDSFTGTILDALVKALRQLHCTVIILSATLTRERRDKLLGMAPQKTACPLSPYPLITAQPHSRDPVDVGAMEIAVEQIPDVLVAVAHHPENDAIEEVLRRAEEGQQILWIENSIQDAQDIYQKLAARTPGMGVSCGLLHSRFTKADRGAIEDAWVTFFGKDAADTRGQQGRILVGTQVLEQSLDIDADFLVTRIAPTDMLLQRLGRLWRHSETARPATAQREAWILSPHLPTAVVSPELAFGATAKVYAPYVLCRSLTVWRDISQVRLPGQIRELIEATYAAQDENEHMARHLHNLETTRGRLAGLALQGLSKGGTTQPEEKAQTRHNEIESTEVLLFRACSHDSVGKGTRVTLLNDERLWLPHNGRALQRKQWRKISAKLMQNTLKVADYLAPSAVSKKRIEWLGDYFYLGRPEYEESVMLRVALVDESGSVKLLDNGMANPNYHVSYDNVVGYRTTKTGTKI